MARRGKITGRRPLKKKTPIINATVLNCLYCGEKYSINDFYDSDSEFFNTYIKLPYCKGCIEKLYQKFLKDYENLGYDNPDRKAMERLCMGFDLYYDDNVFSAAMKKKDTSYKDTPVTGLYFKQVKLCQYRDKNYDTTLRQKTVSKESLEIKEFDKTEETNMIEDAKRFFGTGFSESDYLFLQEQYEDWTTRHECETKSQEEIFKQLCFTQLQLLKAQRANEDTKDLNATFLKQLEVAKLQPKQNSNEANSNAQTLGTLIDKWENTRPIPEIDEDLKDVDKIGLYLDVFFRGHLAKMMGLKNAFSNLYSKFMKKYTVEKPEYNDDEDNEALFDAIFGNQDI